MKKSPPTLGEYLKKKKLSQKAFASQIGWSQGNVSNLLNSTRNIFVIETETEILLHEHRIIARGCVAE